MAFSCPSEMTTYEFEQATGSTLVVRHGDDHGTLVGAREFLFSMIPISRLRRPILVPSAARDAEFTYLNTGVFPKATNQTFVTVYPPGSKRAGIPSPYAVPVGAAAGDGSDNV